MSKAGPSQRLMSKPRLAFAIVEAELSQVVDFFTGYLLSAEMDIDEEERVQYEKLYIARGAKAPVDRDFFDGPYDPSYACYGKSGYNYQPVPENALRGEVRLSRIRSNPALVLIEEPLNYIMLTQYGLQVLTCLLDKPVMIFRSEIAVAPPHSDLLTELFAYNPRGAKHDRYIGIVAHDNTVPGQRQKPLQYHLEQYGTRMPFERAEDLDQRLRRHRFNRGIFCAQLERIGVDPERTLVDRELDDAVMFTRIPTDEPVSEHPETLAPYLDAQKRLDHLRGYIITDYVK